MGLLESLLKDFLEAHPDYSLPARIKYDKVIVPFYYEDSVEAGVGVGFTDYHGSEFFVNGYASNNGNIVFKKVNHDCRIGKKSGFLGALLFLDNVIRFIDNSNYSINFRFIPNLFESIRNAEVEVGIVNSLLLDTYFNILNEELSVQLNDFVKSNFELNEIRVKSLYSTLVNLLNLPLSKSQHSMIINSLNRVDFLPLIKSMIPLSKQDDIGFYSLIDELESLRDSLTSRLSSLSNSITINDPSMNNKSEKSNQQIQTSSSDNLDLSKLESDLKSNLNSIFGDALKLRKKLVDLANEPGGGPPDIDLEKIPEGFNFDVRYKDNRKIKQNINYLDYCFGNAKDFFDRFQRGLENVNFPEIDNFILDLKDNLKNMECYSFFKYINPNYLGFLKVLDYDSYLSALEVKGSSDSLCHFKEADSLISSLYDLINNLREGKRVSFTFTFKSPYDNKSYKLNKRKINVDFHAIDFFPISINGFRLLKETMEKQSIKSEINNQFYNSPFNNFDFNNDDHFKHPDFDEFRNKQKKKWFF